MKRKAGVMILLAALGGWGGSAALGGQFMSHVWNNTPDNVQMTYQRVDGAPALMGPWGEPIAATAPATLPGPPTGADFARAALMQSFPPGLVQQAFYAGNGAPGFQLTGGAGPPATGIGGPGPALPLGPIPGGLRNPPGAVAAVGALVGPGPAPFGVCRTEIRFVGPAGMRISWYAPRMDGKLGFTSQYLEAPARYNFLQSSIYRLKLSDIPARPGIELYPTLEVYPANNKTATFLAHSAVPISFTEEDLEQVATGNFVVKVIYLPDPAFQDLAATGPDEVVSSRLEPGVDPIVEAKRRGSILAIVRLGNIDLEAPNTPSMDAPPPKPAMPMPIPQPGYGMPGAAAMMPPGVGLLPPGITPPNMPMPPVPASSVPSAPATPTPVTPSTPPATTTPVVKPAGWFSFGR
jgi:hypothetical protein